MKKTFAFFILLISLVFLCSCNKNDELGKNSIISTVYADFKNGRYILWAESTDFFSSDEDKKSSLYTAEGDTPEGAWLKLKSEFPHTPYFGHLKAIILGKEFFSKNTKELLTFFLSENSLSPNAAIYISEEAPRAFLQQSAEKMFSNNTLPAAELYTFFSPSNYCSDIPIIELKNDEPFCRSTAVIENFSYIKTLSDKNYYIYSLLKNRKYTEYYNSFEIINSSSTIKTKNDLLLINLNITAGTFVPSSENDIKSASKKDIEEFISYLKENKITHIMTNENFSGYKIKLKISTEEMSKIR